ncbi:MAG: hypothetical protein BAJALOKI1v1_1640004, partial [Promethearchaeota archaeon]
MFIGKKLFYLIIICVIANTKMLAEDEYPGFWDYSNIIKLKNSIDYFDERGYSKNNIPTSGELSISPVNGNVMYNYPIESVVSFGSKVDVSLVYSGNVSFTSLSNYVNGYWQSFSQNRPLWIIGVNGFAVQALGGAGMYMCAPEIQTDNNGGDGYQNLDEFNDNHVNWLIDGYDYCNTMKKNIVWATNDFQDQINILKADGNMLVLKNSNLPDDNFVLSNWDDDEYYTGTYYEHGANSKGIAYVRYLWEDENDQPDEWKDLLNDRPKPFWPRKMSYFPGDGLEYVFLEYVIPYGRLPYVDDNYRNALDWEFYCELGTGLESDCGPLGMPTIFYLIAIRNNNRTICRFNYSKHMKDCICHYEESPRNCLNETDLVSSYYEYFDLTKGRAILNNINIPGSNISFDYYSFGKPLEYEPMPVSPPSLKINYGDKTIEIFMGYNKPNGLGKCESLKHTCDLNDDVTYSETYGTSHEFLENQGMFGDNSIYFSWLSYITEIREYDKSTEYTSYHKKNIKRLSFDYEEETSIYEFQLDGNVPIGIYSEGSNYYEGFPRTTVEPCSLKLKNYRLKKINKIGEINEIEYKNNLLTFPMGDPSNYDIDRNVAEKLTVYNNTDINNPIREVEYGFLNVSSYNYGDHNIFFNCKPCISVIEYTDNIDSKSKKTINCYEQIEHQQIQNNFTDKILYTNLWKSITRYEDDLQYKYKIMLNNTTTYSSNKILPQKSLILYSKEYPENSSELYTNSIIVNEMDFDFTNCYSGGSVYSYANSIPKKLTSYDYEFTNTSYDQSPIREYDNENITNVLSYEIDKSITKTLNPMNHEVTKTKEQKYLHLHTILTDDSYNDYFQIKRKKSERPLLTAEECNYIKFGPPILNLLKEVYIKEKNTPRILTGTSYSYETDLKNGSSYTFIRGKLLDEKSIGTDNIDDIIVHKNEYYQDDQEGYQYWLGLIKSKTNANDSKSILYYDYDHYSELSFNIMQVLDDRFSPSGYFLFNTNRVEEKPITQYNYFKPFSKPLIKYQKIIKPNNDIKLLNIFKRDKNSENILFEIDHNGWISSFEWKSCNRITQVCLPYDFWDQEYEYDTDFDVYCKEIFSNKLYRKKHSYSQIIKCFIDNEGCRRVVFQYDDPFSSVIYPVENDKSIAEGYPDFTSLTFCKDCGTDCWDAGYAPPLGIMKKDDQPLSFWQYCNSHHVDNIYYDACAVFEKSKEIDEILSIDDIQIFIDFLCPKKIGVTPIKVSVILSPENLEYSNEDIILTKNYVIHGKKKSQKPDIEYFDYLNIDLNSFSSQIINHLNNNDVILVIVRLLAPDCKFMILGNEATNLTIEGEFRYYWDPGTGFTARYGYEFEHFDHDNDGNTPEIIKNYQHKKEFKIDDNWHSYNSIIEDDDPDGSDLYGVRNVLYRDVYSVHNKLYQSEKYPTSEPGSINSIIQYLYDGFGNNSEIRHYFENVSGQYNNTLFDSDVRGRVMSDQPPDYQNYINNNPTTYDYSFICNINNEDIDFIGDWKRDLEIANDEKYGAILKKTTTFPNQNIVNRKYYDIHDRLVIDITQLNPDDNPYIEDQNQHITEYGYDLLDRITYVHNPEGQIIYYWYDEFGRVRYKYQPDIGIISYAYDEVGNVRFSQNEEQALHNIISFYEYDELNRMILMGEAKINIETSYSQFIPQQPSQDFPPDHIDIYNPDLDLDRITDRYNLDPNYLHYIGNSSELTYNSTIYSGNPQFSLFDYDNLDNHTFTPLLYLNFNEILNSNITPPGNLISHEINQDVRLPLDPVPPENFENIETYPQNALIVSYFDELPPIQGPVWGVFPDYNIWNNMAPPRGHNIVPNPTNITYEVRNLKGRLAAIAYREHGNEPFNYVVFSYDERGRIEALLKFTEKLGFDAIYYEYNSMNMVISARVAGPSKQYTTWYAYDKYGRMDTVYVSQPENKGLRNDGTFWLPSYSYPDPQARPSDYAAVYDYRFDDLLEKKYVNIINGMALEIEYSYNDRKLLKEIVADIDDIEIFKEDLLYDPSGMNQIVQSNSKHHNESIMEIEYTYDLLGQLIYSKNNLYQREDIFNYDRVGNRVSSYLKNNISYDYYYQLDNSPNTLTSFTGQYDSDNTVKNKIEYGYYLNGSLKERFDISFNNGNYDYKYENFEYNSRGLLNKYFFNKYSVESPECEFIYPYDLRHEWIYKYNPFSERESKRMNFSPSGDSEGNMYPWVYYLLGANKEQYAVYHGIQLSDPVILDINNVPHPNNALPSRVYFYPAEYNTYGIGSSPLITYKYDEDAGMWLKHYKIHDHLGNIRSVIKDVGAGSYEITSQYD